MYPDAVRVSLLHQNYNLSTTLMANWNSYVFLPKLHLSTEDQYGSQSDIYSKVASGFWP